MTTFTIPVVDLADFTSTNADVRGRFVTTLGDALRDLGFFALTGHQVGVPEIRGAYALLTQLFAIDEAAKVKYENLALKGQRGYISFGREHAKDNADAPDLKEFWHVGQELRAGHRLPAEYPANIWPREVPEFKPAMLALFDKLESSALTLLEACSLYLGESASRLSDIAVDGNSILRLIHYPPIAPDRHPASIRAAAHEDINLITLLIEATDSGLELKTRSGAWLPVVTPKDCIIVDAGDMLQNLTNGYFKSTTHRVVNPNNQRSRRLSMPFFVHARSEVPLDPLPSCIARTGGKATFPPITAGQYLHKRLVEIGLA